ncbi:MAG: ribosome hibernation-promoting factor, HPF/YfiA family [Stellaceae bacterium]
MKVTVTGKQFDVGESLRSHVAAATSSIVERYFGKATEAHVVLTRERHLVNAEISVHASRGLSVQGSGEATDPYAAFDSAAERVDKRLRRHKRWLRSHHRTRETAAPAPAEDATDYVLSPDDGDGDDTAEGEAKPLVVAEMRTHIPVLSVSAAVARLDLGDRPALLFRNSARGNLNLVYRRSDGNIGWIDPDLADGRAAKDTKA